MQPKSILIDMDGLWEKANIVDKKSKSDSD